MTYQNQLPVNIPDWEDEDRRFYAACAAMQGLIAQGAMSVDSIVLASVEFADALLNELDK